MRSKMSYFSKADGLSFIFLSAQFDPCVPAKWQTLRAKH